jgi:hypothetical protein
MYRLGEVKVPAAYAARPKRWTSPLVADCNFLGVSWSHWRSAGSCCPVMPKYCAVPAVRCVVNHDQARINTRDSFTAMAREEHPLPSIAPRAAPVWIGALEEVMRHLLSLLLSVFSTLVDDCHSLGAFAFQSKDNGHVQARWPLRGWLLHRSGRGKVLGPQRLLNRRPPTCAKCSS